jgi:hypothetical protein
MDSAYLSLYCSVQGLRVYGVKIARRCRAADLAPVEVPAEIALKDRHSVIQVATGWENAHLFQFHVGRETIAGPGLDSGGQCGTRSVGAGREQLGDLALRGIKRFTYVYDMGDNWASRRLL